MKSLVESIISSTETGSYDVINRFIEKYEKKGELRSGGYRVNPDLSVTFSGWMEYRGDEDIPFKMHVESENPEYGSTVILLGNITETTLRNLPDELYSFEINFWGKPTDIKDLTMGPTKVSYYKLFGYIGDHLPKMPKEVETLRIEYCELKDLKGISKCTAEPPVLVNSDIESLKGLVIKNNEDLILNYIGGLKDFKGLNSVDFLNQIQFTCCDELTDLDIPVKSCKSLSLFGVNNVKNFSNAPKSDLLVLSIYQILDDYENFPETKDLILYFNPKIVKRTESKLGMKLERFKEKLEKTGKYQSVSIAIKDIDPLAKKY